MDQLFYNSFENYRNGNWQTFEIDTTNCNGIQLINRSNGGTADFNNGSFYVDAGQQLTFEGKEKEILSSKLSVRVIAATQFNLIVIKKVFI